MEASAEPHCGCGDSEERPQKPAGLRRRGRNCDAKCELPSQYGAELRSAVAERAALLATADRSCGSKYGSFSQFASYYVRFFAVRVVLRSARCGGSSQRASYYDANCGCVGWSVPVS